MTFDDESNKYTLSSGRKFYANRGLISLVWCLSHPYGSDTPQWEMGEGYDGHLYPLGLRDWAAEPDVKWHDEPWTPEERAEVADYMIALWQRFKAGGDE